MSFRVGPVGAGASLYELASMFATHSKVLDKFDENQQTLSRQGPAISPPGPPRPSSAARDHPTRRPRFLEMPGSMRERRPGTTGIAKRAGSPVADQARADWARVDRRRRMALLERAASA